MALINMCLCLCMRCNNGLVSFPWRVHASRSSSKYMCCIMSPVPPCTCIYDDTLDSCDANKTKKMKKISHGWKEIERQTLKGAYATAAAHILSSWGFASQQQFWFDRFSSFHHWFLLTHSFAQENGNKMNWLLRLMKSPTKTSYFLNGSFI